MNITDRPCVRITPGDQKWGLFDEIRSIEWTGQSSPVAHVAWHAVGGRPNRPGRARQRASRSDLLAFIALLLVTTIDARTITEDLSEGESVEFNNQKITLMNLEKREDKVFIDFGEHEGKSVLEVADTLPDFYDYLIEEKNSGKCTIRRSKDKCYRLYVSLTN